MSDVYTGQGNLAGLMKTLVADTQAAFYTSPVLLPACLAVEAQGSRSVQFPVIGSAMRTASATATDETSSHDSAAINIAAVNADLVGYATLAKISNIALMGGDNVSLYAGKVIAGQCANAINTGIAIVVKAFDAEITDCGGAFTLTHLSGAVGTIRGDGYNGKLSAVLHPNQYYGTYGLANSLIASSTPPANAVTDELLRAGWTNNIMGVDIYLSHSVQTTDGTCYNGGVFAQEAVGVGYHNPIINIKGAENLDDDGIKILGASYFKVMELDAAGGCVRIDSLV